MIVILFLWQNHKKFSLLFFFIASVVLLTGCWDRREVNDLALVRGAGLDRTEDGKIELTVIVYIPKGGGSKQGMDSSGSDGGEAGQTLIRSAEGATVAEAMSFLQEKLPRQIFWGHCEVFIFDEEMAKEGLAEPVDFFIRMPDLRERSQLFVSGQKAKEILTLLPPLERDIAEVVRELGEQEIGMKMTTKDFAEMLLSDSGDAVVPWLKILPPMEGQEEKQTIAYITGSAIFKKDIMVGQIDDSVTRGLLWLRDEVELAFITIQPKDEKGYISMKLLQAQSKIIPKITNGKWEIILEAVADDDIIQNTTNLNMSDPKVVKFLEHQLKQEIVDKVKESLEKVQKDLKADVFGFADAFHRKYPKIWQKEKDRWNDIFPNVDVKISVRINIRRQGMNSVLPHTSKEEVKEE